MAKDRSRLVTDADNSPGLNSPQAGALGEGWSDFYAKDFLVKQFPGLDTAASTVTMLVSCASGVPSAATTVTSAAAPPPPAPSPTGDDNGGGGNSGPGGGGGGDGGGGGGDG